MSELTTHRLTVWHLLTCHSCRAERAAIRLHNAVVHRCGGPGCEHDGRLINEAIEEDR